MRVDRVEEAYRAVHGRLWRSLLAFTGDAHVASDAESEAFAQAIRRGDAIDDVAAWVWRTAFRVAAGMLGERRSERPMDVMELDEVEIDQPVLDVLDLLDGLSVQQRACVVLRHVGGMEPREIADALGTTSGTVRVQLHRAHRQLRHLVEEPAGRTIDG